VFALGGVVRSIDMGGWDSQDAVKLDLVSTIFMYIYTLRSVYAFRDKAS